MCLHLERGPGGGGGHSRGAGSRRIGAARIAHLFIFGFGYTGRALACRLAPDGWAISGTSRTVDGRQALTDLGITPVDPADNDQLQSAAAAADAWLISAPPGDAGCPGLDALAPRLRAHALRPKWIGYLSTTGVYGDRGGGWVFEQSARFPGSPEGHRRLVAENGWDELARTLALNLSVFRLPGIYGPGRSALDRVRAGDARRMIKPGHVFSRIHVDDLAGGLAAALAMRERDGAYNLCDDEPAAASDVTAYAARLLGLAPPPEVAFDLDQLSPMARRFWAESKRASNARAKAALGWRPTYPTYREGIAAILATETADAGVSRTR